MKVFRIRALLYIAVTALPAGAQVGDTANLSTVVVSASKTPANSGELTQSVTVITGSELRARGIARVSDALRSIPGAAVVENGSIGSVNTLFIRGGESRYTKVLIDGVAVNAPGGFFDFSHLTTDNIDRIEIVRGPASVVHGADAVSGVVQIFTRQGAGAMNTFAELRGGSQDTREASLGANGGSGRARYSAAGSARRTDGIYTFNNQYYNGTLSASAGLSPRSGADVLLSTRYTAAEFHYPTDYTGAPVDSNAYRVQHRLTVGLAARTRISRTITGKLLAGANEVSDLTEDIAVPFGSSEPQLSALLSRHKRRSIEAGAAAELPFSATLNVGVEYVDERERSVNEDGPVGGPSIPGPSFSASRTIQSLYGELIGALAQRASYTIAARLDDNSDYGSHATYRVGASVPLTSSSRVRASLSTAFNSPAFNQLRPTLYTSGSPGLQPEKAWSWEIGAEHVIARGALVLSAALFRQRFTDMIQYVAGGPPDFLGSFDNLTEAESDGVEVEARARPFREISATASYSIAEPRVVRVDAGYAGGLAPGDALIRRPSHSANGSVSWTGSGRASLTAAATWVGRRPDLDFTLFPSPVVTLPSYTRVDVSGTTELIRFGSRGSSLSLTGRIDNLFDRRYEDVLNFRTTGRMVLVGARYSGSW